VKELFVSKQGKAVGKCNVALEQLYLDRSFLYHGESVVKKKQGKRGEWTRNRRFSETVTAPYSGISRTWKSSDNSPSDTGLKV
jgi:hypothetical protein